MKKIAVLTLAFLLLISLFGCFCKHDWSEATCIEAEACKECGKTNGEPKGHNWKDATCTSPSKCSTCGETTGNKLGHDITDFEIVKEVSSKEAGLKQQVCKRCNSIINAEYIYYYDITDEEVKLYTNILNTVRSLEQVHLNPDSFKLLGAVATHKRTTIYLSYKGTDGKTYSDYFWKDLSESSISNRFGIENYQGHATPVEKLDLKEIEYFKSCGAYVEKLVSTENINVSY